jgi:hypothetical protein
MGWWRLIGRLWVRREISTGDRLGGTKGVVMHMEGRGILANLDCTQEELSEAWSEAISMALRNHKRAGVPVATWDQSNHRVLLISPEELSIPSDESPESISLEVQN